MSARDDEFYIGWAPAPPGQRRFTRHVVLGLLVFAVGLAAVLASRQMRPSAARFEFGHPRPFHGRLALAPVPALWTVDGQVLLLVAPGKHGAADLVAPQDGRTVDLAGTLIERPGLFGPRRMIEIEPGSVHVATSDDGPAIPAAESLGAVRWRGEIVDGKCFLGVMVPGEGKTHRGCAARCLAGGTPPLFALADGQGGEAAVVIATAPPGGHDRLDGAAPLDAPLDAQALAAFAAEPVTLRGTLERHGPLFVLRLADTHAVERAD